MNIPPNRKTQQSQIHMKYPNSHRIKYRETNTDMTACDDFTSECKSIANEAASVSHQRIALEKNSSSHYMICNVSLPTNSIKTFEKLSFSGHDSGYSSKANYLEDPDSAQIKSNEIRKSSSKTSLPSKHYAIYIIYR